MRGTKPRKTRTSGGHRPPRPGRRVLAFVLVLAAPAPGATADWVLEGESLRRDPRVGPLLRLVSRAADEALAELGRRFALLPGELPIRLRLVERLPGDSPAHEGFEAGRTVPGPRGVTVFLPARRYLSRPRKAEPVVVHELAHATLASHVGSPGRYRELSSWFREGFALHVSGEGESRVAQRLVSTVMDGHAPGSFLRGLGSTDRPAPAESYLAFRCLAERLGDPGLRAVIGKLRRGRPLVPLLSAALGLNERHWLGALEREVRSRIDRLVPAPHVRQLRGAIDDLRRGEVARGRLVLAALRRDRGARVLHTTCRYFLARAHVHERAFDLAGAELEPLVVSPVEGLWEAEALDMLAECALARGDASRARAFLEECLERFPEDTAATAWARRLWRRLPRPRHGDAASCR
ncbi:MAG: tetratricopeptide repeat protein [Planctomycetota bacterium]|nr:tetratricopeptide repeat protein [Planctomycetota bacterium]